MRVLLAAAVVAVAVLAGCAGPSGPVLRGFFRDACDPSGAAAINGDAPMLAAFNDALGLAKAIAAGAGEGWTSDTPTHTYQEERTWATSHGTIHVWMGDTGLGAELSSTRAASFTPEALASIGRNLGVTEEGSFSSYPSTRQSWLAWGWPTHRAEGSISAKTPDGSGQNGYLSVSPIHSLAFAHAEVSKERAVQVATAYARCDLDRDGKTEAAGYPFQSVGDDPRFEAHGDSLVIVVSVAFSEPAGHESHCGLTRFVAVDAVTAAVVGEPIVYCE